MKILYCDDLQAHRDGQKKHLEGEWAKLEEEGVFHEALILKPCADIVDATEAAEYDAVLLDLLWGPEKRPYGIELAEKVRKQYPEKPIMVFTVSTDAQYYDRLLAVNICAYLRKAESSRTTCLHIMQGIDRARKARKGQCLYKRIRETARREGWSGDEVDKAASAVWKFERPHDRWSEFWNAFDQRLELMGLASAFREIGKFFGDADLLMLSSLPGMRGHLEHVLNVYFTGYVISNNNGRFRAAARHAANNLKDMDWKSVEDNDEYYWSLFQLAWLAAATFHDAAYPLEVLPDTYARCTEVKGRFAHVLKLGTEPPNEIAVQDAATLTEELATTLTNLKTGIPHTFLQQGLVFNGSRVNHGVAGGLLFASVIKSVVALPGSPPELKAYLQWAGSAMALHALKVPGSKQGVKMSLEKDPLSYLLLACDEIQVWDRERPDASMTRSPFKSTELTGLDVENDKVEARVTCHLYENVNTQDQSFKEAKDRISKSISDDKVILNAYVDGCGLKIVVKRVISAPAYEFDVLTF